MGVSGGTSGSKLAAIAARTPELINFEADDSSNVLWVVFSHVDIPSGKFAQMRVFSHLDGSKLFLNCLDNAWYSKGVGAFSNSLESTIRNLLAACADYDVRFIGHSMGAYMSLICGNLAEGARFLSTSPELHLRLPQSRADRNNVQVQGAWGDVQELRQTHWFHGHGVIVMGVYDPIDCYFLSRPEALEGIGAVYEAPHHHGVTEFMTSNGVYLDLLRDLDGAPGDLQRRGFLAPAYTYGRQDQYELFYRAFVLFNDKATEAAALSEIVERERDWCNPGWQEQRAKILRRLDRHDEALEAAERAYHFQPDLIQFIETYATACFDVKDHRRLLRLADSLTPQQLNHRVGARVMERIQGQRDVLHVSKVCGAFGLTQAEPLYVGVEEPFKKSFDKPALQQARKEQRFDDVLEMTQGVNDAGDWNKVPLVLLARAEALLNRGEHATGLRLLRAAAAKPKRAGMLPRVILDTALAERSLLMLEVYLDMELGDVNRSRMCRDLVEALAFVREPGLAAQIVAEIARYGRNPGKLAGRFKQHLGVAGLQRQVAIELVEILSAAELSRAALLMVVEFMICAGLRKSARNWLNASLDSCTEAEGVLAGLALLDACRVPDAEGEGAEVVAEREAVK